MIDDAPEIPHGLTYEKSVLSCLLKWPDLLQTTEGLGSELFYLPSHQILLDRLLRMVETGQPIELTTIRQTLHDEGELDMIGGLAALADIYSYATNSGHFDSHLAELRRYHALRRALAVSREIEQAAWDRDADAVMEAAGEPVSGLLDLLAGTRPRSNSRDALRAVVERFQALCRGEQRPQGILTSLGCVNHRFGGLHAGDTIVVSGYPGTGKSVLSSQLLLDACLGGERGLVLTLEMSSDQWMQRAVCYAANLPGEAMSDPLSYCKREYQADRVTKDVMDKAKRGFRAISDNRPEVEHLSGPNASQCAAIIRREHRKAPLRVVVLDFIQRMRPRPGHDRDSFERVLADAAQSMADLARELGFTLIMGSQLSKEGAAKWAEAINEAADLHLKIDRDKDKRPTGVVVEKDRHHGHGGERLDLYLQPEMIRFTECRPERDEAPRNRFER